jgi:carboxypeptidase Q
VGAAYGGAVNQRSQGAIVAARYGALAVIVRSMTTGIDDYPHTGAMRYVDTVAKIPACAISTKGAEHLSVVLKQHKDIRFFLNMNCQTLPDEVSYNVVGEIKGSEHPDEIIVVGGHLDSWDLGEGAHDDGAGVVQSMEILYLFKKLGIRPKRTVRIVAFMNEENGVRGANKYAELAAANKEKHMAAMESDSGGFSPMGFQLHGEAGKVAHIKQWSGLFTPYFIYEFGNGHGGTDIEPLAKQGTTLIGLSPNSQRYFDYHHCALDKLENVDERELEMGAAAMAAMVYLLDHYGI